MLRLLLQPKYRLYEHHDRRLREAPRPDRARKLFSRRLRKATRINSVRIGFYVVVYFAAVAAVISFALTELDAEPTLAGALKLLAGLTSSVTIVAFGGILVCNRYLALADVELGFYSAESRMRAASPPSVDPAGGQGPPPSAVTPEES